MPFVVLGESPDMSRDMVFESCHLLLLKKVSTPTFPLQRVVQGSVSKIHPDLNEVL